MSERRRKRPWLWAGVVLLAIIVLATVGLAMSGNSEMEKEIAAIRKAGLPTSGSELDQWYGQPPRSENAALLVEQAISQYVSPSGMLASVAAPPPGETLTAEMKEAISQHVENNQAVIEILHEGAQLKTSRYSINLNAGAGTLLPHLSQVKGLTLLLRYEAMLHSANRNSTGAVRSLDTSFALARTLRNEPFMISELVGIACTAINLETLERLLKENSFDRAQLRAFGQQLEEAEEDSKRSASRAMIGERAMILPYFLSPEGMYQLQGRSMSALDNIQMGAFKMLGLRDRDLRLYLEMMGKFTAAATNDFPEMVRRSEQIEKETSERLSRGLNRFAFITKGMRPAISKAFVKEAALVTRLRAARIALAIEEYRLSHQGALPENLDALVPNYLKNPLLDPVEAQPFQFEARKDGGYQVTSAIAGKKLQNQRSATFTVYR